MWTMLSGDVSLVVGHSFGITDLRVRILFAVSHPFAIATPQSHSVSAIIIWCFKIIELGLMSYLHKNDISVVVFFIHFFLFFNNTINYCRNAKQFILSRTGKFVYRLKKIMSQQLRT